jgi:hypothetical protein
LSNNQWCGQKRGIVQRSDGDLLICVSRAAAGETLVLEAAA